MSAARQGASDARACAYLVVRRVFEQGAYADRALHAAARTLDARERSLAMRLSYGTIQRTATLDHLIRAFSEREPAQIDAPLLAALRLGLYQLHYADGIADHAAVSQSVELARGAGGGRGSGLVNAVLRRSAREGASLLAALSDDTPADAATAHSMPLWLAQRWFEEMGAAGARALMARCNEPAESALRANALVTTADALAAELGVETTRDPTLPEALVLGGPFDAHASPRWREGAFMPQSRGSMLVARALDPRPGQRVLDLCAAPGAKTTHAAALMSSEGAVVAVERHAGRAAALRRTCERMRAPGVEVLIADARAPGDLGTFDRVLVDPPCSGLGTLQSRPDLRWRASPERIDALVVQQREILDAAAPAVAPGGRLAYSTCTLCEAENEDQVRGFLQRFPDFALRPPGSDLAAWQHPLTAGMLMALPHQHGTDGFFVAILERDGAGRPAA